MGTIERVRDLAEPVCAAADVELVDVELAGGVLRLTVDRSDALDLDVISGITRRVSRLLDEDDPVPGRYTLEVSSPGLERPLRTPAHFQRAVGATITVRTTGDVDGDRRVRGTLLGADAEGITVRPADDPSGAGDRTLRYDQIDRARTVFEWGPAPKPGGPSTAPPGSPKKKAGRP